MPDDKLQKLTDLLKLLQNDTLKPSDVEQFLTMVLEFVTKSKTSFDTLSAENLQKISDALSTIQTEHSDILSEIDVRNSQLSGQVESKVAELQKAIDEVNSIEVNDGADGKDGVSPSPEEVVPLVLEKLPKPVEETGETIAGKLEILTGDKRLDASAIKNLPESQGSKGSGLRNVFHDTTLTGTGRPEDPLKVASSGTVGPGTINEIAYFNTTTTIASLAVATYPSLTELSYVKGVTSAIQTQLNSKITSIADPNADRLFGWDDTDNAYKFITIGAGLSYDHATHTLSSTDVGGTVTTVSVVTANGVSGSVANPTTTPAITLTLGAITPTSVNSVVISGASTPTLAVTGTTAVSGTNTGDQTSVSGNAGTVTVGDAGGDTTTWVLLGTSQTGSLSPATDASLTYNATTNALTADTFIGALTGNASTATALQNARTIGGVSFDGTANITVATATGGFTISGGNLALGTNSITMTGSLGTTGARLTKGWFTDLQVTNAIAGDITGNAATVTTNANLTGVITSVGNATSIASQTGTGTKFVVDTSPTLVTPNIGVATATTVNKLTITAPASGSTLTIVDGKTLTVNKTISFTAADDTGVYTLPTGTKTIPSTADNLSVFAATTSAQLLGVMSDETGTGFLVFATSPTISTPRISQVIGGTAAGSNLNLQATTNASASAEAIVFKVGNNGGTEAMRITGATVGANLKIAGTASRGTTEGTNHLDIFDGTAPVGTLANGISIYSASGIPTVMDSSGNANGLGTSSTPQFARIGIGAAADSSKLFLLSSAAPDFQMTDTTGSAKSGYSKVDGNKWYFQEAAGADGSFLSYDLANTRIGFGIASPEEKLDFIVSSGTGQGGDQGMRLSDTAGSGTAKGLKLGINTTGNGYGYIQSTFEGTAHTNLMLNQNGGNVKIGGTAARGTTEATKGLYVFDGTAPAGTLANGVTLYSASGEPRVMDSAGNSNGLTTTSTPQFTRLGLGAAASASIPLIITNVQTSMTSEQFRINRATPSTDTQSINFAGGASVDFLFGRSANTDDLVFGTNGGGGFTERFRMTTAPSFKVGGTAGRGTTEGSNQVVLFNGTAPAGTLTNGASFFCASGEMKVIDSAGNVTQLSPHSPTTNEWIFNSKNTVTGKVLVIEMERFMKFLNKKFGGDFIKEYMEAVNV